MVIHTGKMSLFHPSVILSTTCVFITIQLSIFPSPQDFIHHSVNIFIHLFLYILYCVSFCPSINLYPNAPNYMSLLICSFLCSSIHSFVPVHHFVPLYTNLSISVPLFTYLYLYAPTYASLCRLCSNLVISLSLFTPSCPSLSISVPLYTNPSISLSLYLSISSSFYPLSVPLYTNLFISLSLYQSLQPHNTFTIRRQQLYTWKKVP